ncbi:STAS domain-containing protein [Planosporangium thailandense]|uniref:Anti-sigma factor antagonist n=1 Tax=Planosporangium thailandense TaxID=765197 RepID=A0ABX0XXT9_9ACTN|nr:STAS domain-containing protein [Planosporangium thailandense]
MAIVQLACSVERTDGEVTIVLAGEADLATIDQLRDVLFDAVQSRPARVVVDLRGLVFIDSMSIGTLVAARRAALEHGAEFTVTHPRGQVFKVLKTAGVLGVLTAGDLAAGDLAAGGYAAGDLAAGGYVAGAGA